MSYVYIAGIRIVGKKDLMPFIKIGHSQDPEVRAGDMTRTTRMPVEIIVIDSVKFADKANARRVEFAMHELFPGQRVNGEWFTSDDPEKDAATFIAGMRILASDAEPEDQFAATLVAEFGTKVLDQLEKAQ